MVHQYLNFFSSFSRIEIVLFSSMMTKRKPRNPLYPWLNFWKRKALFLAAKCMNLSHLSNCRLLKNTCRLMEISAYVGAEIIRWQINKQTNSIEKQKAPICRRSFFYTHRRMMTKCTLIIASYAINCNTLMGCYV
jgi:Fe-S-cluster containining protein